MTPEVQKRIDFAKWTARNLWSNHRDLWYQYNNEDNPVTSEELHSIWEREVEASVNLEKAVV